MSEADWQEFERQKREMAETVKKLKDVKQTVYASSKEQVAAYQKMADVMNAKHGGGGSVSESEKALQDYVALINAAPDPAANIHRPADPTPDQLLEWVADEIGGFDWEFGTYDEMKSIAQRIIDTVKRVTG